MTALGLIDVDQVCGCIMSLDMSLLSDLMEIIAWLLHPNENQRATLQDIKRDPWVQQPIRIEEYKWKKVLPNSGESYLGGQS